MKESLFEEDDMNSWLQTEIEKFIYDISILSLRDSFEDTK